MIDKFGNRSMSHWISEFYYLHFIPNSQDWICVRNWECIKDCCAILIQLCISPSNTMILALGWRKKHHNAPSLLFSIGSIDVFFFHCSSGFCVYVHLLEHWKKSVYDAHWNWIISQENDNTQNNNSAVSEGKNHIASHHIKYASHFHYYYFFRVLDMFFFLLSVEPFLSFPIYVMCS